MKHTKKTASFLSGMLTALLLVGMVTPALASGLSKRIEVSSGVSIDVEDVKLNPRDANGNPVEVFIYNGTTYLPVRAVSEALEVPVQWDGSTRSVYVGKHTGDKPAVWLENMDYFSGDSSIHTLQSDKDNAGNTYYHCIYDDFQRTYLLNGQYSKLTGTIYQRYDYRSTSLYYDDHGLWIYGDGELIYSCPFEQGETGIDPINFDIDLTGILKLEIVFDGFEAPMSNWKHVLALGNIGLWT